MSSDDDALDPVARLADEFVARYRRGERPNVSEYAQRYPELADRLRQVLPVLVVMEEAGPDAPASREGGDPVPTQPTLPGLNRPETLRDYRLLREIGRGGMGVVYEAEQLALGRRVALKVLPLHLARQGSGLERFRREARAAARLHHENIVPVYEVGEEGDLCYYAMQLIDGRPLDQFLDERRRQTPDAASWPDAVREVARVGIQVAEALAYAHRQGVLHRDIKPSNLLRDGAGRVWVADFGLAKTDGDTLTQTGDVVGTIPYMAPERFRGWSDPRSDVYSLGLTLYELLALRPAFRGSDRYELIHQVTHDEPPPLRKLVPAVPRDLETVIARATDKEPARRYPTAGELAADLRRFLEDRPVLARRAGFAEHVGRWCRRHPAVALLSASVLALLVVIAVGATLLSLSLGAALTQAEKDRDDKAQAERDTRVELFRTYEAQARTSRLSRRVGQRLQSLATVEKAVALARELGLPAEALDELRTDAIAALALTDLTPASAWVSEPDEKGWTTSGRDIDGRFRLCAVASTAGDVSIRRVAGEREDAVELTRLRGLGHHPFWGPDGQHLAVADNARRLRVGKVEAGGDKARWVRVLDQPFPRVGIWSWNVFDFSPDCRRFVHLHEDGTLRTHDLASGKLLDTFPLPAGCLCLAHHPREPRVAMGYASAVRILDLTTGRVTAPVPSGAAALCLAWHPRGELLAVADQKTIQLWDVPRQRRLWGMEQWSARPLLAFDPTGAVLASTGFSGHLRLWDALTGTPLLETVAEWSFPRFGPENGLAVIFPGNQGSNPGLLSQVVPSREYRAVSAGGRADRFLPYQQCTLHPGGRLLAAVTRDGVGLLDLATGDEWPLPSPRFTRGVLFEPSGALLVGAMGHGAGLYRRTVRVSADDPGHLRFGPPERIPGPDAVDGLARSERGTVLATSVLDLASVWDRDRPGEGRPLEPHRGSLRVALSPDGRLAVTGAAKGGTGVRVWDARTGTLIKELIPDVKEVYACFSGDGAWLATNRGRLWRVEDWSEGPAVPEGEVAFAPRGGPLAVGPRHGAILLIDPATGRVLARLEDPERDNPDALIFAPDGTRLIAVMNTARGLCVWDLALIRQELARLGLDWDAPPYPPRPEAPPARPLRIDIE